MVWGCITSNGVGWLYCVTGTMNAAQYCMVLEEALIPLIHKSGFHPWNITFQQDNTTVHTAKVSKNKITALELDLMPWLACSPEELNQVQDSETKES